MSHRHVTTNLSAADGQAAMTFQSFALDDIANLQESAQVEFKLAGGRDGQGQLPEDIWATYSSFANTLGGEIILGVREERGQFTIEGIPNPPVIAENAPIAPPVAANAFLLVAVTSLVFLVTSLSFCSIFLPSSTISS